MRTSICIFEDEGYRNLLPLTYLRPSYDLRCGILTLREKIVLRMPNRNIFLHSRKYLEACLKERYPRTPVNEYKEDNIVFINGRLIFDNQLVAQVKRMEQNSALVCDDTVVLANISVEDIKKLFDEENDLPQFEKIKKLKKNDFDARLIKYPWELVNLNGDEIKNDYEFMVKKSPKINSKKIRNVEFNEKENVYLAANAEIDPFVFLDASEGPIYIDNKAHVMSHSIIQGPVFIGEDSIIKSHSSIYHNTSIGEVCKVGGEVESSIIHSYSNKQHEGFLGHSYLGSWINIGASTNNSDLKNNYSSISVLLNNKPVDTGCQLVGLIMGDHSKTAINTMFNTGTIVGVSCNIFGSGFPPRYFPSFSWGGSDFLRTYNFEKSLEAAKLVAHRRNVIISQNEIDLLKKVFEMTFNERIRKP